MELMGTIISTTEEYVLSLNIEGLLAADNEKKLVTDGESYRKYVLNNNHPLYKEVVQDLKNKKFVVLKKELFKHLFLLAPIE